MKICPYSDADIAAANRAAADKARRRAGEYRLRAGKPVRSGEYYYGVTSERLAGGEKWQTVVAGTSVSGAIQLAISRMQTLGLDFGAARFDNASGGPAEFEVTSAIKLAPVTHPRAADRIASWTTFAAISGHKVFQSGEEEGDA